MRKLWPERTGFNPQSESILINGRPFPIVGQFRFYEREDYKRWRELGAKKPKPARPTKGGAGASRGSNPFERKKNAVLIPITTMFYEFKSAKVVNMEDQALNQKLDQLSVRIADATRFDETLAQVQEVVPANHMGIEDFIFLRIVVESGHHWLYRGAPGPDRQPGRNALARAGFPAENAPELEWSSVLIGFSFAVVIGVASGFHPALKASRQDPISALRFGQAPIRASFVFWRGKNLSAGPATRPAPGRWHARAPL